MKRRWIAGAFLALVASGAWAESWITLGPGPAIALYVDPLPSSVIRSIRG